LLEIDCRVAPAAQWPPSNAMIAVLVAFITDGDVWRIC